MIPPNKFQKGIKIRLIHIHMLLFRSVYNLVIYFNYLSTHCIWLSLFIIFSDNKRGVFVFSFFFFLTNEQLLFSYLFINSNELLKKKQSLTGACNSVVKQVPCKCDTLFSITNTNLHSECNPFMRDRIYQNI